MFETAASVQWFFSPVNALINVEKQRVQCVSGQKAALTETVAGRQEKICRSFINRKAIKVKREAEGQYGWTLLHKEGCFTTQIKRPQLLRDEWKSNSMAYRLFEGKDHASIYQKYRFTPPAGLKDIIIQYLDKKVCYA